jgi:hypothetical protein
MHLLSPPSGNITIMPARSYLIFGDIEGKLDVLCVESPNALAKAATAVAGSSRNMAARQT